MSFLRVPSARSRVFRVRVFLDCRMKQEYIIDGIVAERELPVFELRSLLLAF